MHLPVLRAALLVLLLVPAQALAAEPEAAPAAPAMQQPSGIDQLVSIQAVRQPLRAAVYQVTKMLSGIEPLQIEFAPGSPDRWYGLLVSCQLQGRPLHEVLDAITAQVHCRWRQVGGLVVIDHPLPPEQLQQLRSSLAVIDPVHALTQLDALDHAARELVRSADLEAQAYVISCLGDPVLDRAAHADLPATIAYQRQLLHALGAFTPGLARSRWDSRDAYEALGAMPAVQADIARCWSRGLAARGPLTPMLCYLAGVSQLGSALPDLRLLASTPEAVMHELDPHRPIQHLGLIAMQASAIWALGRLHDQASAPLLRAELAAHPEDPLDQLRVVSLTSMQDAASLDAIIHWRTDQRDGDQALQYLAVASLAPEQLAQLLPPHRPLPSDHMLGAPFPDGWWQGIAMHPVPEVIQLALAMEHVDRQRSWGVSDGFSGLARLPRALIEPALRRRLQQAQDPHLCFVLKKTLSMLGDLGIQDELYAAWLAPSAAGSVDTPWEVPYSGAPVPDRWQDRMFQRGAASPISLKYLSPLLDCRGEAIIPLLMGAYESSDPSQRPGLLQLLGQQQRPETQAFMIDHLQVKPQGQDDGVAAVLTFLNSLPAMPLSPQLREAMVALFQHPDQRVAAAAVNAVMHLRTDNSACPQALSWLEAHPLESVPAALVHADGPWNLPGPPRRPLLLEESFDRRLVLLHLRWMASAKDPQVRSQSAWWLGIHTLAYGGADRVLAVQGLLQQLQGDADESVRTQCRDMLTLFLGYHFGSDQGGLSTILNGSWDDAGTLTQLDALHDQVAQLLRPKTAPTPAQQAGF